MTDPSVSASYVRLAASCPDFIDYNGNVLDLLSTRQPDVVLYVIVLGAICVWTVIAAGIYVCLLKARLDGAPSLGAQFFWILGFLQLFCATGAVILFVPTCSMMDNAARTSQQQQQDACPDACIVPHWLSWYYAVPAVLALVGITWFHMAWNRWRQASVVVQDYGDGDGAIFTKIPSEPETELTERSDENDELGSAHCCTDTS